MADDLMREVKPKRSAMDRRQVFLMFDAEDTAAPKRLTVAVTIEPGLSQERIRDIFWNAYLTWHKVDSGALDD